MRLLYTLPLRLRSLFRRGRVENELDEELRDYLERRMEQEIAAGATPEEALHTAKRALGGLELRKEECRDTRSTRWIEDTVRDLRYAIRMLRTSPALSFTAIFTIAIGVGAATGMFSIMWRLLLAPPPHVASADRVFRLHLLFPRTDRESRPSNRTSYPFYELLAKQATSLEAVAAYNASDQAVDIGGYAHMAHATIVSAGFWKVLGTQPAIGRFLADEEAHPATGSRVVVLSHAYWQARFGGSTGVLGQTLHIKGQPYQIIGVTPRGFRGVELEDVDLWLPLFALDDGSGGPATWHQYGSSYTLSLVARLKPEVTAERAAAELTVLQRSFYVEEYAKFRLPDMEPYRNGRTLLGSLTGGLGMDMRPIPEARVTVWLVSVAFVLLTIACANVAGLLLLRAMRRRREIAVRLALGVSRARLAVQLLTESAVLAVLGGAMALLVLVLTGAGVQRVILPSLAWEPESLLDVRVIGIAALCILGAAFGAGLVPLFYARFDVMSSLRDGTMAGPPKQTRAYSVLLMLQGALSVVLLIGAGLFLRSLHNAQNIDIGLERDETVVAQLDFSGTARSATQVAAFYEKALESVSSLPGVDRASVAVSIPLRSAIGGALRLPGAAEPAAGTRSPYVNFVTPGFFAATGMRLLQGRDFSVEERSGGDVIIVSDTVARLYWPGKSPVGECVFTDRKQSCTTVIGVVADSRRFRIQEESWMNYFRPLPFPNQPQPFVTSRALLVRRQANAARVDAEIVKTLRSLEANVPFVRMETLGQALDPEIRPWRLGASVFTTFGILAAVLAMVGLWSSAAYAVSQRRREFAIRKAVGAGNGSLAGLILRGGLRVAVVSVTIGTAAAALASPLIADLLFQVQPRDTAVFVLVGAGVLIVAVLANLAAAWRVTRIMPSVALRHD